MSWQAVIVLVTWSVTAVASVVMTARAWTAARDQGSDGLTSTRLSVAATLPGIALLGEYLVRLLYAEWSGTSPLPPEALTLLLPATLWLLIGPLLFVASAATLPLRNSPRPLLFARAAHLATWILSAYATLLSLVSV